MSSVPRRGPASRRAQRLALALIAAVLASIAIQAAPAAAGPFETGISGIGTFESLAFQRTRSAGARFVRLQVPWATIAPGSEPAHWNPENPADPAYDWSYLDTGVKESVAAGLTPVLQIDGAPTWAQRCKTPAVVASAICDPDPAALAAFATAAARRYDGGFRNLPRVKYWQGLNEPNLSLFFFPQFNTAGKGLSAGLYRTLANSFYAAVKSVQSSDLVIAAGLGPTELKNYNIGPLRFTRELLCMKGGKKPQPKPGCAGGVHFDIFDIHPYTTGGPTHEGGPNDVEMGDLGKLQTLLAAADRAGHIKGHFKRTPLWITEFGWDSKPPDPGGLTEKILTQWTAEAMHEAWAAGVQKFFWYTLRDEPFLPGVPASETAQSGLYTRGATLAKDKPKPVLASFRFPFVAFAAKKGLEIWGRTPTSHGGRVTIQSLTGGHWGTVGKVNANAQGIFVKTLRSDYGQDKKGAVRAVFAGGPSAPFPMKRVGDFYQPPFG